MNEQLELIKKEQEDWKSKVVVDNTHFKINARQPKKPCQQDKQKTLLEDEPKKLGLRLPSKRLKECAARQIFTTKTVENMPSTIFASDEYKPPQSLLSGSK